jgi:hypothetical protein
MNLSIKASTLLARYKDNEADNSHAENYVLLASYFGTDEEIDLAYRNLAFRDKNSYTDDALATECYVKINPYYKRLVEDAAKGIEYKQPV